MRKTVCAGGRLGLVIIVIVSDEIKNVSQVKKRRHVTLSHCLEAAAHILIQVGQRQFVDSAFVECGPDGHVGVAEQIGIHVLPPPTLRLVQRFESCEMVNLIFIYRAQESVLPSSHTVIEKCEIISGACIGG